MISKTFRQHGFEATIESHFTRQKHPKHFEIFSIYSENSQELNTRHNWSSTTNIAFCSVIFYHCSKIYITAFGRLKETYVGICVTVNPSSSSRFLLNQIDSITHATLSTDTWLRLLNWACLILAAFSKISSRFEIRTPSLPGLFHRCVAYFQPNK